MKLKNGYQMFLEMIPYINQWKYYGLLEVLRSFDGHIVLSNYSRGSMDL